MKAAGITKETILSYGIRDLNFPNFRPGDEIILTLRVKEGDKERTQLFEGIVLGMKGAGITKTLRIRKIVDGVSIERVLPYYSPIIEKIVVVKENNARRNKIYYLRKRKGKESLRV